MTTRKIVLCDDDEMRVQRWKEQLENLSELSADFEVKSLTPHEFAAAYKALEDRQLLSRRGEQPRGQDDAMVLDEAEIVVVDFDLTPRQPSELADKDLSQLVGSFGDVFAYLTRCYTTAGFTVLVNQTYFQSTFDLTMSEFVHSFADLNISDSDLTRKALWVGSADVGEFRPWHWPHLLSAAATIRAIKSAISLDAKVFEALGLEAKTVLEVFDAEQLEPLGVAREPEEIENLTFSGLTKASCVFGRRSLSEKLSEEQELQLAASAFSRWLEKVVLPAQNVFIDAPHLGERRPHLVRNQEWGSLLSFDPEVVSDALRIDEVSGAATEASRFFSRPVWYWPACPAAPFDLDPGSGDEPEDLVFCEDISAFLPVEEALEFRSSVAGPWTQRFVSREKAEHTGASGGEAGVDYRPETRFF